MEFLPAKQSPSSPTVVTSHSPLKPGRRFLPVSNSRHCTLLEMALLGEELLQGFDEGIRIAQRLGDGLLFDSSWWKGNCKVLQRASVDVLLSTTDLALLEVTLPCIRIDETTEVL